MSGTSARGTASLDGLTRTIGQMMDLQRDMADRLMDMVSSGSDRMMQSVRSGMRTAGASLDECCAQPSFGMKSMTGSCCDIPEPCWMPKCLGEFHCALCPGATGTLTLRITNDDLRVRQIQAIASGPDAQRVSFSPSSLTLGPKERGIITARLAMPAEDKSDDEYEAILWVRGCRDYYVRWTAETGKHGGCCAHDLRICDGPDHVLHWYDHFYCPRPCQNRGRQDG